MLNVLCLVKQVLDSDLDPHIVDDKVYREYTKSVINPYDAFGIKLGLEIKKTVADTTITSLSVGSTFAYECLKFSLALGCDKALLLRTEDDDEVSALSVARLIYDFVKDKKFDIIFTGKEAIDDNAKLVGPVLASLLDIPFAHAIRSFTLDNDKAVCERESFPSNELLEVSIPAVFSCDKALVEHARPSLQALMRARKKTIEEIPVSYEELFCIRKSVLPNDVKREQKLIEGSLSDKAEQIIDILCNKGIIKTKGLG